LSSNLSKLIIADFASVPLPQAFQPSFALQSCGIVRNRMAAERIISQTNFFSPEIIIRFQPMNSNSKAKATKVETVETVSLLLLPPGTGLKPGVNETTLAKPYEADRNVDSSSS
jgi:hypothetical protein